jgi:hypothetical protein
MRKQGRQMKGDKQLMNKQNKKTQVVISVGLAKHLIAKGFHIIDLAPSKKDHTSTVFIFTYNEALQYAMNEFFEQQKRQLA